MHNLKYQKLPKILINQSINQSINKEIGDYQILKCYVTITCIII